MVGLVDAGGFAIGDTLSSADGVTLEAVPSFEPEHFAVLHTATPAKYKQFNAGLDQLAAEGAIQVLRGLDGTPRGPILAAVGPLQFDVVRFRLEAEYGVRTRVEALGYRRACRLDGRLADILALPWARGTLLVRDGVGRPAGLFDADARLRDWDQRCPAVQFLGWSAPGAPA